MEKFIKESGNFFANHWYQSADAPHEDKQFIQKSVKDKASQPNQPLGSAHSNIPTAQETPEIELERDEFADPMYLDPNARLPRIQALRGTSPKQCGYFVPADQMAKAGWFNFDEKLLTTYTFERKSASSSSTNLAITVPKTALKELQKLLGNPTESKDDFPVKLLFNDTQIIFSGANFTLVCRALAGNYPDYHQLIPSTWSREVSVSSQQILAAVTRLATFDKHKIIRLVLNQADQVLSLYVEGKDIGSGAESLPALIHGEDFQIGFDADVLIPAIKAIPASELRFSFNKANHPATINLPDSMLCTATVLVMPVELCSETPKPSHSSQKQPPETPPTAIKESEVIDYEPLLDEPLPAPAMQIETKETEAVETESTFAQADDADLELAALPM